MNMILFSIFSGVVLFSLISFIRYITLYNSHSVKNLSKKTHFPAYDIGVFIKKLRYTDLQNKKISYTSKDSKENISKHTLPLSPVIADSAAVGANVFRQYMCIDDNMYEGVSRLSGENINNFSDLSAKLKTYKHDSQGLTEGSLNKIKGHIAESHVTKHFQEAGIEVNWPEASNQEGWDLLLNDNPIQVKLTNDANSLIEHFKTNPEIPVIIPSDADNIPETAFHFDPSDNIDSLFDYLKGTPEKAVIVDNQLSNVDLTENIEEGTDLLTGATDFNFHFITIAFSGFREIKLLKNKDTDIISAFKNAGLDIAGVTMSTLALSFIPIPGIQIIGPPLGRKITNKIKQMPLKNALKEYEKSAELLKKEALKAEKKYRHKFKQDKDNEQHSLNKIAIETKNIINKKIKNLRKSIVDREKSLGGLQYNLLKNIPDTITLIKKELKLSWIEYFWPSKKIIIYKRQMKNIKQHFTEQFKNSNFLGGSNLFQQFSEKGLCRRYILSEIKRTEEERKVRENNLVTYITQKQDVLLQQRSECMKRLSLKIAEYAQQIRKELSPYIKEIQHRQNLVKQEAGKLRINPTSKSVKKEDNNKNLEKGKSKSVLMETLEASDKLVALVGSKKISRQKAIKHFWDYVKKKKLQDSKDRRNINLDDTLKKLIGHKKQVSMFEATQVISRNLK